MTQKTSFIVIKTLNHKLRMLLLPCRGTRMDVVVIQLEQCIDNRKQCVNDDISKEVDKGKTLPLKTSGRIRLCSYIC